MHSLRLIPVLALLVVSCAEEGTIVTTTTAAQTTPTASSTTSPDTSTPTTTSATTATTTTTTTTTMPGRPLMHLRDLWVEPTADLGGLIVWVEVTDAGGRGIGDAVVEVSFLQWGVTLEVATGADGLGTATAPGLVTRTWPYDVFAEPISVWHPSFLLVEPYGGLGSLVSRGGIWDPLGAEGDPLGAEGTGSAHYGVRNVLWCPRPEATTVGAMRGYGAPVQHHEAAGLVGLQAWKGYLDTSGTRWLVLPEATFLVEAAAMVPCEGPGDIAAVQAHIASAWPPGWSWMEGKSWDCVVAVPGAGDLGPGSVAKCVEVLPPEDDSQHTVLTVLVLDTEGALAVTVAGTWQLRFNPWYLAEELGSGKACAHLAPETYRFADSDDPRLQYLGVVLYWFVEGRPARMDPDGNGRPCEELVPAEVVDEIWAGGWFVSYP